MNLHFFTPTTPRFLRFAPLVLAAFFGFFENANAQATNICMKPNQVRLIPNSNFQPNFYAVDAGGNETLISSGLTFTSSNSSVVAVNPSGVFSSSSNLGEATISATWNGLNFQTKVKTVADFVSPNAEKRVVKVAMVIIDPQIPAAGGQRFSEHFWSSNGGPMALAQQTRDSIFSVSGGTIEIQIVETHQESDLSLNRFGGSQLSVDSLYKLFLEPGATTLHTVAEQTPGGSVFLYNEMLDKYDFCEKSNAKQIDEIWVWAMPFIGMWESNMAGTDAFWINGPVISGNSCTDLVAVMGFNYERYAGCALHNYTHRIELTMAKVYNTFYNYSPNNPPYPPGMVKDPYQLFQNYDALQGEAGNAHVGNGHFPPNGIEDYDYDNLNFVPSRAKNWKRYPILFDQTEQVNCEAWGCEGDCGINFCSYWLRHLPHFKCKDKTGRLNNWWTYIFDYNEGRAMEAQISDCNCKMFDDDAVANCTSKSDFPWHEWISRVKINDLDNPSGKSHFSDFSNKILNIAPGGTYSLALSAGFSYFTFDEYFRVWLDKNKDGIFDESEKIAEGILQKPADGTPEATLNLPNVLSISSGGGAISGMKMRVSMKRGGFPTACETIPFGEVEDYTVNQTGIIVKYVNLEVKNWSAPQNAALGQTQNSTFDLVNSGTLPVPGGFSVGVFLSTDNLWAPNDLLVGSLAYPNMGITTFLGEIMPFSIPQNTAAGSYFLILRADFTNQITELDESDNTLVQPISVQTGGSFCQSKGNFPWEDWIARVKMADVDNSSGKNQYSDFTGKTINVNAGTPVGITLGAGFSYFTFDEYWKVWIDYNQNGIFEEADETYLSLTVPRPADGTPFFDANTSAFVKGGFTQDFTTRMRVAMKRGGYPTPCETFAFGEVEDYSIHIAPGGGNSKPDLSLLNFLAAGSGAQGAVVPYFFDLKNSGTANATGNFTIGAYLSTDQFLDGNDVQVGIVPTGNIPVQTTIPNVQGAITVPANLAVGNYFFILKADIDNTIAELDELNNLISRPFSVTPGSGGGGADLELTLAADKTNAAIYSNVVYTFTVKNTGNQTVTNAEILIAPCPLLNSGVPLSFSQANGLVYAGIPAVPTVGSFNFIEQRWTVSNLAPGQSGSLKITLFTLTNAERKVMAFSSNQSPADPDSQPSGGLQNCTASQDDEAIWTINAGQTLLQPGDRNLEIENHEIRNFDIFPNPAGAFVFVKMPTTDTEFSVSIFNQIGILEKAFSFQKTENEVVELDLSEVKNGVYFLKIETAGQRTVVKKLVVGRMD